jgi:hypothetical protein
MLMERWWKDTEGKTEVVEGKPIPMPVYSSQIAHGLTWDLTRASVLRDQRLNA